MSGKTDNPSDVNDQPIEKAEEIIELFGGIRPMASKMDVAVTTVQGWKKRNVIPANRRDDVVKAAKENDIKISSYIKTADQQLKSPAAEVAKAAPQAASDSAKQAPQAPSTAQRQANENTPPKAAVASAAPKAAKVEDTPQAKPSAAAPASATLSKPAAPSKPAMGATSAPKASNTTPPPSSMSARSGNTQAELKAMTDRAFKRNLMVTSSLIAVALVFGFFMFSGDDVRRVEQDLTALQRDVGSLENRTSLLEGWVPENLSENLSQMKEEAQILGQQVGQMAATLTDGDGSIMNRIMMLEQQLSSGASGASMQALMSRIESMSSTMNGQEDLSAAMQDLSAVVTGMQAQVDGVDTALERAKQDNDALAEALEGVTGRDLGAAAMLLALEHARSSFNRSTPFEEDLKVLQSVVGEGDPELNEAISRLAPYAAQGVLSTDNLSNELKSISGEILMAKMAGEDASFQDKALERFNQMVTLSKNGVPVTGAEEEAIIARAQTHLANGDVEAAKMELAKLEGEAAQAASPWMDKADGNLAAQNLEEVILQEVLTRIQGLRSGGLFNGGATGGGVLIDPSSGMTIQQ